ncbi:MAG: prolyl oligopeptidase family serine peptidase, partial [Oscillospiraceae bacterium]
HRDSISSLLGDKASDKDMLEIVSLENQVSDMTPPMFIWHTYDDNCVPVENSLLMAMSLKKHNIPLEMHIYPQGSHGLALCSRVTASDSATHSINPYCEGWIDLAIKWVNSF